MTIRQAINLDKDAIHKVHSCAFPAGESGLVSKLALDLLGEETTPQTLSLVAEIEGAVVGHVAFSPVSIDKDESFKGYILAPLGVMPEHQKTGVGTALIENGLQRVMKMQANVVFVYGDPKYYNRFGFSVDVAQSYVPPYKLQYPFGWQAVVLNQYAIQKPPAIITCVGALRDPQLW